MLQQHYSNSCWQDSAPLRFYELQPRVGALLTSSSLLVVTAIVTLSPLPCQTYQLPTTNYFLSMTTPLPELNIILRWEFSSALNQHLRSFQSGQRRPLNYSSVMIFRLASQFHMYLPSALYGHCGSFMKIRCQL